VHYGPGNRYSPACQSDSRQKLKMRANWSLASGT
jgi:hypothetical protein